MIFRKIHLQRGLLETLTLLALSLTACTSIPGLSTTPEGNEPYQIENSKIAQNLACPSEFRIDRSKPFSDLPPVYQGDVGICYAKSAADLLFERIKGHPQISPMMLALLSPRDYYKPLDKESLWFEGGTVCNILNAAKQFGKVCRTNDVWIENQVSNDGNPLSPYLRSTISKAIREYLENYKTLSEPQKEAFRKKVITLLGEASNESFCSDQSSAGIRSALENLHLEAIMKLDEWSNDAVLRIINRREREAIEADLKILGTFVPYPPNDDGSPLYAPGYSTLSELSNHWIQKQYLSRLKSNPNLSVDQIFSALVADLGLSNYLQLAINKESFGSLLDSDRDWFRDGKKFKACEFDKFLSDLKTDTTEAPLACEIEPNFNQTQNSLAQVLGSHPNAPQDWAAVLKILKTPTGDPKLFFNMVFGETCFNNPVPIGNTIQCASHSVENPVVKRRTTPILFDQAEAKIVETLKLNRPVSLSIFAGIFSNQVKPEDLKQSAHALTTLGYRKRPETGCELELLVLNSWDSNCESYIIPPATCEGDRVDPKDPSQRIDSNQFWLPASQLKKGLHGISYLK